jgi:hypothetical protein
MREQLNRLNREAVTAADSSVDLDAAGVARLEALGYVMPTVQKVDANRAGPDPKSELPLMQEALGIMARVDIAVNDSLPLWREWLAHLRGQRITTVDAIERLEALAAANPNSAAIYGILGLMYKRAERPADVLESNWKMQEAIRATSRSGAK